MLRKRAASSWLHLGHTSTAGSTKQSYRRNLEAKAWAEATTSAEYSRGAEHHQAASMAQSIQDLVEDQFRFMAGSITSNLEGARSKSTVADRPLAFLTMTPPA